MGSQEAVEPTQDDYPPLFDFAALDEYYDACAPTKRETLERAVDLADEALRAVLLQVRRYGQDEPEDDEWLFRRLTDFHFLVNALWSLRLAAFVARSASVATDTVSAAIKAFDDRVPALAPMRHVGQHLDDYAVDHSNRRRQTEPGSGKLIGRRRLQLYSYGADDVTWVDWTLNLPEAVQAAETLYAVLCHERDAAAR
jgi:hypothetical protein